MDMKQLTACQDSHQLHTDTQYPNAILRTTNVLANTAIVKQIAQQIREHIPYFIQVQRK